MDIVVDLEPERLCLVEGVTPAVNGLALVLDPDFKLPSSLFLRMVRACHPLRLDVPRESLFFVGLESSTAGLAASVSGVVLPPNNPLTNRLSNPFSVVVVAGVGGAGTIDLTTACCCALAALGAIGTSGSATGSAVIS